MKTSSSIQIQHFNLSSMGTRFDFLTYGLDEAFFNSARTYITNELERIEKKFSRYDPNSVISGINRIAANESVPTDAETISLLSRCIEYYHNTNRLFDITVGMFTQTTNNKSNEGKSDNNDHNMIDVPGSDKIVIDFKDSAVHFLDPQVAMDLGGIGKGYAMEKIKQYCTENMITNALISFGDSSITTLGTHPHGDHWPIGIQHAFSSGLPLYTFRLNDSSLSTSGNTPNNRFKFGSGGHILNPLTGEFQNETKTITIVTTSPVDAEVLSTALFIAGDSEKAEILSRFRPSEAIEISYNQINEHRFVDLNHEFTIIAKEE